MPFCPLLYEETPFTEAPDKLIAPAELVTSASFEVEWESALKSIEVPDSELPGWAVAPDPAPAYETAEPCPDDVPNPAPPPTELYPS